MRAFSPSSPQVAVTPPQLMSCASSRAAHVLRAEYDPVHVRMSKLACPNAHAESTRSGAQACLDCPKWDDCSQGRELPPRFPLPSPIRNPHDSTRSPLIRRLFPVDRVEFPDHPSSKPFSAARVLLGSTTQLQTRPRSDTRWLMPSSVSGRGWTASLSLRRRESGALNLLRDVYGVIVRHSPHEV